MTVQNRKRDTDFVSLFMFYILSYLPSKTMGCFSGRLMSSASDQKLFCEICSAFSCSFNEFVGEKVVSPSYSSAICSFYKMPGYGVERPESICINHQLGMDFFKIPYHLLIPYQRADLSVSFFSKLNWCHICQLTSLERATWK